MQVKRKSYIKPFEKVLAMLELEAITHTKNVQQTGDDFYKVQTDTTEDVLLHRLAYWESAGEDVLKNTTQVLLENTSNLESDYIQLDFFQQTEKNLRQSRILRYGVHDLHEYRGKFFPQLVRACINISEVKKGAIVFDPFCGSGTTLCEARISGMKSIGIDLNPLSALISKVKTTMLDSSKREIEDAYQQIQNLLHPKDLPYKIEDRWTQADRNYLIGWFAKEALEDIHQILCAIEQLRDTRMQNFFKLNLSNILRSISWQKESDLRVRKEVGSYLAGDAQKKFLEEARRQIKKISPYLEALYTFSMDTAEVIEDNTVTYVKKNTKYLGQCDVLITSPPYATSLPYLDTDRLSLLVLGLMHRSEFPQKNLQMVGNREISEKRRSELWNLYLERKSELTPQITELIEQIAAENHKPGVGFRRRNLPALLAKYFLDMLDSIRAADAMLKPGAKAFYVVGSNSTYVADEKIDIKTNQLLWDLARNVGWRQVNYIDMDMPVSRDVFRKHQGTSEAILIFEKGL